ncbi:carboxypeptidase M32 [Lichenihabitans psoromatis]|uniref:carboxypeptidase M32 n=1 Tax=Lichenihabitans psoromatis TaxID=2528642 RepID=UPI0010384DFC|nr:carboxypeptidase M32 [Lichenihabitans psoromatis]
MSLAPYDEQMGQIADLLCAVNVLHWDARTLMPAAGAAARGKQIATLTGLARDLATGEPFRAALDAALEVTAALPADDLSRRAIDQTRLAVETLRRIPKSLIVEAADLAARAESAWVEARRTNDFDGFAPYLERTVALQRQRAEAIGYAEHPYDALVGQYEPGMTLARLDTLYATLRAGLLPLIERARSLPEPRLDLLRGPFPIPDQKAFASAMAARMGYDFARGRLDDTAHPFEISFDRTDVRITGRFRDTWLPSGFFGVWHEAGHGMYEQGLDPAFSRSIFATDLVGLYAVGGASFGMHESQSRLWENRVGRSRRFWALHCAEARAAFPRQLADADADSLWRAVNHVAPGLIRVEADELTYDLHIMFRTDLEAALMAGDLAVRDLPGAWSDMVRRDLGLDVPNHRDGVLQDVHWAAGLMGSFPTYTLGNVMSSQLFAAAGRDAGVTSGLERGDYAPLAAWLGANVHRHGRSLTPDAILRRATGSSLDPAPYLADLTRKVDQLAA